MKRKWGKASWSRTKFLWEIVDFNKKVYFPNETKCHCNDDLWSQLYLLLFFGQKYRLETTYVNPDSMCYLGFYNFRQHFKRNAIFNLKKKKKPNAKFKWNAIAQYQLEMENVRPTYLIMVMHLSENILTFFYRIKNLHPNFCVFKRPSKTCSSIYIIYSICAWKMYVHASHRSVRRCTYTFCQCVNKQL